MVRPPYGDGGTCHAPKITILAEAQNWRCAYCTTTMTRYGRLTTRATVDHVIPKASGGKATWDNEVAACLWCNSLKGDFAVRFFMEAITLYPGHDRDSMKTAYRWMVSARAADNRRIKRRRKRHAKAARRRALHQTRISAQPITN